MNAEYASLHARWDGGNVMDAVSYYPLIAYALSCARMNAFLASAGVKAATSLEPQD